MAQVKSEIRMLLAAARRGDFSALLAAADYWQEASPKDFERWGRLLRAALLHTLDGWRRRHRMSAVESLARWFRDWARATSKSHGGCWKIKYPLCDNEPAWAWCRDMAHSLLKYARALKGTY